MYLKSFQQIFIGIELRTDSNITELTDQLKTNIMGQPRIKNEDQYEALRDKGYSKEKAARIANTPDAGKKGGKADPYEEWTKDELYDQAKNVGIDGRSKMNKRELISALSNN